MIELTPTWRRRRRNGCAKLCNFFPDPVPPWKKVEDHCVGAVYLIICKPTAQAYVGQSKDVNNRLKSHRYALRSGRHHSKQLQEAWNEHGESAFLFAVVERKIDLIFLHCREQFWMWRFDGRLLNASRTAHPDMSTDFRANVLKGFSDEELIAELKRRNTAVMVVS